MDPRENFHFYFPLTLPLWIFFFIASLFLLFLIFLHVLNVGFARLGFSPAAIMLIIFGALIGSAVNIPVKRYVSRVQETIVSPWFFGMRYRVPLTRQKQTTVLAVNLGGCIVPVLVSLVLLFRFSEVFGSMLLATAICTFVINRVSRVVRGVGIVVPFFIPPLTSALVAMLVTPAGYAPVVAYVAGATGTLVGADLLNLSRIKNLGAPVASIGGAGTWDGIFLSSLVASLIVPV